MNRVNACTSGMQQIARRCPSPFLHVPLHTPGAHRGERAGVSWPGEAESSVATRTERPYRMIELATGDLLACGAEALVNPVNCDGVMGRGLAAQFKRAFPATFESYRAACKRGEVVPGRMNVFELGARSTPRFIINFPTKRHWRNQSRMKDIEAGLEALVIDVQRLGVRSIAIPPLGCGLGGLDWKEVRPRIERAFESAASVKVIMFEPAA